MKSEEIAAKAARYNKVERIQDAYGRMIGVRRLKPSEQLRLQEMAPNLEGSTKHVAEDGTVLEIPKLAPLFTAATVCEVDGAPFTFPKSRPELDAVLDRLDQEGLIAAMEAYSKLVAPDGVPEKTDVVSEAKNS